MSIWIIETSVIPPPHEHVWIHVKRCPDGHLWACQQCGIEEMRCLVCGAPSDGPPRGPCAGHGTAHATYD